MGLSWLEAIGIKYEIWAWKGLLFGQGKNKGRMLSVIPPAIFWIIWRDLTSEKGESSIDFVKNTWVQ